MVCLYHLLTFHYQKTIFLLLLLCYFFVSFCYKESQSLIFFRNKHRFNQVSFIYDEFLKAIINHSGPIKQIVTYIAQKGKFCNKVFFRSRDPIRRKLRIWSNLRKKSLMEIFVVSAVLH